MGFIFSSRSRLESVFKPKEISYRGLRHCIQVKEQGNRNEVCWPSSCFLSPFPIQNPLPREWDSGPPSLISPGTIKVIPHWYAHRSTPSRQLLIEILSLGDSRVCHVNN